MGGISRYDSDSPRPASADAGKEVLIEPGQNEGGSRPGW